MLHYHPRNRKYPGNERFREATVQHKSRRKNHYPASLSSSASTISASTTGHVTKQAIKDATGKRLCGNLCTLIEHMKHIERIPNRNSKVCVVCGRDCYQYCMKCIGPDGKAGVALHADLKLGSDPEEKVPCFYQYHNTFDFGLARNDHKIVGLRRKDWKEPSKDEISEHRNKIRRVLSAPDRVLSAVNAPAAAPQAPNTIVDTPINWNNVI